MSADLQPVTFGADVVGVVDHPACQPEHPLLERVQTAELFVGERRVVRLVCHQIMVAKP